MMKCDLLSVQTGVVGLMTFGSDGGARGCCGSSITDCRLFVGCIALRIRSLLDAGHLKSDQIGCLPSAYFGYAVICCRQPSATIWYWGDKSLRHVVICAAMK